MKIMEYARDCYLSDLPFPKGYRVEKFTSIDPADGKVCEIHGPGVLKRLWTTHNPGNKVRMYMYIDGEEKPILHGYVHELAAAAEKVSCREIPLGGKHFDVYCSTFYLPVRFEKSLRIEMEKDGPIRDGVYWQVECKKNTDEQWPRLLQKNTKKGIELSYEFSRNKPEQTGAQLKEIECDLELEGCAPCKPIFLEGPALIRRIELTGEALDKIGMRIAFDGNHSPEKRVHGPFQVNAPLRYLVGKINSACIERLGTRAIIHFPMPFQKQAVLEFLSMLDEGDFYDKYRLRVKLLLERKPENIDKMYYFHARYACTWTNGTDDFECCSVHGKGHFVGINIFDSGHNHGGGDNIFFDADRDSAGQLHGICGEDYFHHAYHFTGTLFPYAGCPTHGDRYRHHIEMPIPFQSSFVFNWGVFAGQAPKAVSFWYQEKLSYPKPETEMTYRVTGPFPLEKIDHIDPDEPLPETAYLAKDKIFPRKTWYKLSQKGFVDLCHIHRHYEEPYAEGSGLLYSGICARLETHVWAAREEETEFFIGCDDPIRVYLNGKLLLKDEGRHTITPFRVMKKKGMLEKGKNNIIIAVCNLPNTNWNWFGFSLVLCNSLTGKDMLFLR